MVKQFLALSLALVACGGPVEETLVDELRILAMVPDAPEVGAGEATPISVLTVDPTGEGYDLLVWTCTSLGPPGSECPESVEPLPTYAQVIRAGDPVRPTISPAANLAPLLVDGVTIPSSLRALACLPGTCEIMDQVEAAGDSEAPLDVVERLTDVGVLLREEPILGVAASQRSWMVSGRPPETRNQNPVVATPAGEWVVDIGNSLTIELEVADDEAGLFAYGYATAGGFGAAEVAVLNGTVLLEWFAPAEDLEAPVLLFVVVQDARGGSTVWNGTVTLGQDPD
jgi:hypothetical protein